MSPRSQGVAEAVADVLAAGPATSEALALRLAGRIPATITVLALLRDLDGAALDLACSALKPGHDHFVVALDAAQNIYRKRGRWNPRCDGAGTHQGPTANYRNTQEILSLAYGLLSRGGEVGSGVEDEALVVPPRPRGAADPTRWWPG